MNEIILPFHLVDRLYRDFSAFGISENISFEVIFRYCFVESFRDLLAVECQNIIDRIIPISTIVFFIQFICYSVTLLAFPNTGSTTTSPLLAGMLDFTILPCTVALAERVCSLFSLCSISKYPSAVIPILLSPM